MYNEQALLKDIRERLSDHRYNHSLEVAVSSKKLAEKYGGDIEKAYIAGLSHDILKELSYDEFISFFEKEAVELTPTERSSPKLWHAIAGAKYLEKTYNLDSDIISAVRYHTTGKADMTLLEKILFTADFISADRDYDGVEDMRRRAECTLEYAMTEGLRFTVEELAKECRPVHPDSIACYNQLILERKKY